MRKKHRLIMVKKMIVAAVLVCLGSASCAHKKKKKKEDVTFSVTAPIQIDTTFVKQYVAQIRSVQNVEIRTQERGFLERIYVDEGQFVNKGQLLFKIMPRLYQAELQKAQAEAKAAAIELKNAKTLADKNIVSRNEQLVAQARLEQANAAVSMAKLHLSFTEIRAPFSGTVDRIPKKLGSLIDEGEMLTTLSDNSHMFAYFNVSEPEYLDYKLHVSDRGETNVDLLLANGDTLPYKGKIEVIESEFDAETGNIAFRAGFPNPKQLLKHGETGKVQMQFPMRNALVIPQKTTYEIQDKKFVFVVNAANQVKSREIVVAGELPDLYVVKSGLKVGEKIVLDGLQKLNDNDHIKYAFEEPKALLKKLKLKAE